MTVDMLDTGTILVTLEESDMRAYTLDFSKDADSGELKRGLADLIGRIGEICGFGSAGRCWLVEVLPARGGCLLIITVRPVRRRRRFRVKRDTLRTVCVFENGDALLDFISRGSQRIQSYTVYLYGDSYVLIPELYSSEAAVGELGEYGSLQKVSPVAAARVREYGDAVFRFRAQRRHPSSEAI